MNKKIHKILACIDFSEYSLMVLEYAVELAKGSDSYVLVYNFINESNYYLMATVSMYAQVPAAKRAALWGDALSGTMDSWVIWNLAGGPDGGAHVTDVTNASRT